MGVAALRTEHLSKRYGRLLAVDDLTLDVAPGEVFGFLGPNGAGKSTTIRMLLGLARPTSGRAWIFDADAADVAAAHRLVGHVPADVALWPRMTGAEVLHLLARIGPASTPPTATSSWHVSRWTCPGRPGRTPPATGRRSR